MGSNPAAHLAQDYALFDSFMYRSQQFYSYFFPRFEQAVAVLSKVDFSGDSPRSFSKSFSRARSYDASVRYDVNSFSKFSSSIASYSHFFFRTRRPTFSPLHFGAFSGFVWARFFRKSNYALFSPFGWSASDDFSAMRLRGLSRRLGPKHGRRKKVRGFKVIFRAWGRRKFYKPFKRYRVRRITRRWLRRMRRARPGYYRKFLVRCTVHPYKSLLRRVRSFIYFFRAHVWYRSFFRSHPRPFFTLFRSKLSKIFFTYFKRRLFRLRKRFVRAFSRKFFRLFYSSKNPLLAPYISQRLWSLVSLSVVARQSGLVDFFLRSNRATTGVFSGYGLKFTERYSRFIFSEFFSGQRVALDKFRVFRFNKNKRKFAGSRPRKKIYFVTYSSIRQQQLNAFLFGSGITPRRLFKILSRIRRLGISSAARTRLLAFLKFALFRLYYKRFVDVFQRSKPILPFLFFFKLAYLAAKKPLPYLYSQYFYEEVPTSLYASRLRRFGRRRSRLRIF